MFVVVPVILSIQWRATHSDFFSQIASFASVIVVALLVDQYQDLLQEESESSMDDFTI